ncbi:unnamed protein product [Moneuplotes crassus]|uniref:Uncharacterized protein n=1 Tax=Euplotes crassus TaxID=5936 RepID=A0AAD1X9T9_EUPCR|nr:unnamed protein product [Moneuplotes crassus]
MISSTTGKDEMTKALQVLKSRVDCVHALGLELYILYGGNLAKRSNQVYTYNPNTNAWAQPKVSGKPPPATFYNCIWYEEPLMYVMGGETEKKKTNDLFCLNTETWTWRKFFIFESPAPRYQHSITRGEKDSTAIMFGGFSTKNLNDLWELDMTMVSHTGKGDLPGAVWNSLSQKGTIPPKRRGHKIIKIPAKNQIVLYGGYTLEDEDIEQKEDNDLYILDLLSVTWSKLKLDGEYPEPRALHSMTFFTPQDLLIFGGEQIEFKDSDENSVNFLNDVYIINLPDKKLKKFTISSQHPCPLYEHVCILKSGPYNPKTLIFGEISTKYVKSFPVTLSYHCIEEEVKLGKSNQEKLERERIQNLKSENIQALENKLGLNTEIIAEYKQQIEDRVAHEETKQSPTLKMEKMKQDLDALFNKKSQIEKDIQNRNQKLKAKFEENKAKFAHFQKLVKEKQSLAEIYQKKAQVLEQNFGKAELFLLKMLSINERLEALNPGDRISIFDQSESLPNPPNLESLKIQHKKALLGVREFYSSFSPSIEEANSENSAVLSKIEELHSKVVGAKSGQ